MSKTAICFLTIRPSKLFCNFCKQLKNDNYDVFICVDDNSYTIAGYYDYHIVPIIKIPNSICESSGFKSTVVGFNHRACSRDKALYYFCKLPHNYKHIWMIEEDVFIPHINTIKHIDDKYNLSDLLCSSNETIDSRDQGNWFWPYIFSQTSIDPPYGRSMICAIRISKNMLNAIEKYASKYHNLFMDEAFFNTMAMHNKLSIETPIELSTILWRKEWALHEISVTHLYHPIKSIEKQYDYRRRIHIQSTEV